MILRELPSIIAEHTQNTICCVLYVMYIYSFLKEIRPSKINVQGLFRELELSWEAYL